MKTGFIFPPMWDPFSNGSLGIWNYQVTKRLAKYCDVLVYFGLSDVWKGDEYYRGVHYRNISTSFDRRVPRWLLMYPSVFSRVNKPFHTSMLFFLWYAFKVACDLRRQKCDIVHLYNYPQFIPIIKAVNPRIRVVLNVHGELLSQFELEKVKRYLAKADYIISCSEFISNKIRTSFPQFACRCETVFMGVDLDRFSPKNNIGCASFSEVKRLLYVGRLSPEKGLHILLDAFATVAERYPETVLDIVGQEGWIMPVEYLVGFSLTPTLLAELKQCYSDGYSVSDLCRRIPPHLLNRVTFHGQVDYNKIHKFYADSDVYINPSYYESFGMSNIESMACGTPVVTSRVGAVPEVVEHDRTGILVEPGDPAALADGIIKILDDSRLRKSITEAAYEKAVSCFSWQCACDKLYALYNSIR